MLGGESGRGLADDHDVQDHGLLGASVGDKAVIAQPIDDQPAEFHAADRQRAGRTLLPGRQAGGDRVNLRNRPAVAQHSNNLARLDKVEAVLGLISQVGKGGFMHRSVSLINL